MKEKWLVFYHGQEELAAYTIRGTFQGELEETIEFLCHEKDIPKEEIRVACEMRGGSKKKQADADGHLSSFRFEVTREEAKMIRRALLHRSRHWKSLAAERAAASMPEIESVRSAESLFSSYEELAKKFPE